MFPCRPKGLPLPVSAVRRTGGRCFRGAEDRARSPSDLVPALPLCSVVLVTRCAGICRGVKRTRTVFHVPARHGGGCPGSPATPAGLSPRAGWRAPLRSACVSESAPRGPLRAAVPSSTRRQVAVRAIRGGKGAFSALSWISWPPLRSSACVKCTHASGAPQYTASGADCLTTTC